MEPITPQGAVGSGGVGTVAILELETDAKDKEIGRMTDLLVDNLGDRAGKRHHPPPGNDKGLIGSGKALASGGDSLCITGHSCYAMDGRVKRLDERHLGGYPIEAVSAELSQILMYPGYRNVELWCCETARDNRSEELRGGPDHACHVNFNFAKYEAVKATTLAANVSTMDYLCVKLIDKLLADKRFAREDVVSVVGLTGVGYISPGMDRILTIGPDAREEALDLRTREAEIAALQKHGKTPNSEQLAKVERLKKKVESALESRRCDYVVNLLDFKELREGEEKRRAALKATQASGGASSSGGGDGGKAKKKTWNDPRAKKGPG